MTDSCEDIRKAIAGIIAGGPAPADPDALERHLGECPDCRRHLQGLLQDDRLLNGFIRSVDERLNLLEEKIMESINDGNGMEAESIQPTGDRGESIILRGRFLRFAAAAVVVIGLVVSARLFLWPGGRSVAWANVIRQVEEAQDYICHIEKRGGDEPELEMVQYNSAEHGLRIDIFRDGRLVAAQHLESSSNTMCVLIHRDRTYTLVELTDEQRRMITQSNAKGLVEHFRSMDFEEIGSKRIDGIDASGIEIHDPDGFRAVFDESTIRLWVDERTNWPVRLEWEGVAMEGKMRTESVLDRFQWNPALSADDFAFEIPDGYTMAGRMEAVRKDKAGAIEGLREYAAFSGGRYPSTLAFATALHEMDEKMRAGAEVKEYIERIVKIQNACAFYTDLVDNDRDAAYYGAEVNARDFDRVLMRWRLDDGMYRVIYGDLREETVSAGRLGELEGRNSRSQ
jgi:hypothetical protein